MKQKIKAILRFKLEKTSFGKDKIQKISDVALSLCSIKERYIFVTHLV